MERHYARFSSLQELQKYLRNLIKGPFTTGNILLLSHYCFLKVVGVNLKALITTFCVLLCLDDDILSKSASEIY